MTREIENRFIHKIFGTSVVCQSPCEELEQEVKGMEITVLCRRQAHDCVTTQSQKQTYSGTLC